MRLLSIGQVAKTTGVGIETVRYYEREGLLEEPLRKDPFMNALLKILNSLRHLNNLRFTPTVLMFVVGLYQAK